MAKANREREFLVELKRSFQRHEDVFWYKIPDAPIFEGQKTRFTGAKPFDALLVYRGIPIAIEAKYQNCYKSFGTKQLRQSQIQGLQAVLDAGGQAYVFLNVRSVRGSNTPSQYAFNRMIWRRYPMTQLSKKELRMVRGIDKTPDGFDVSRFLSYVEDYSVFS